MTSFNASFPVLIGFSLNAIFHVFLILSFVEIVEGKPCMKKIFVRQNLVASNAHVH